MEEKDVQVGAQIGHQEDEDVEGHAQVGAQVGAQIGQQEDDDVEAHKFKGKNAPRQEDKEGDDVEAHVIKDQYKGG